MCVEGWVESIGPRFFRRPLSGSEVEGLASVFLAANRAVDDHADAARATLEAFLMMPQTLYRLESQAPEQVSGFELASRLSFLVRGAGPDEVLYASAAEGGLSSSEAIQLEVQRMLSEPDTARRSLERFLNGWLTLHDLESTQESLEPSFDAQLVDRFRSEAFDLTADVWLTQGLPLNEVIRADHTLVDAKAAGFYGYDLSTRDDDERVPTSADVHRKGLLTTAGWLASAGGNHNEMIFRALFVYQKLLCESVPVPPEGATEAIVAEATASERTQSEARRESPGCVGCHSAFDSYGYPFETFEQSGLYRTQDRHGNDVRTDGEILDATGSPVPYANASEFAEIRAEDPRLNPCIVRQLVEFAWGRTLNRGDTGALTDIVERFEQLGSTYEAALVAITTHESYREPLQD
ncbi:MAG: DUF1592 domain-containing protein [Myxococcota bacterium]